MESFDKNIIVRHLTGQCSDEELARLRDWVNLSDDNAREFFDAKQIYLSLKADAMEPQKVDEAYERLRHRLRTEVKAEKHAISIARRWRYLGIVLLLVCTVGAIWIFGGKGSMRVSQQYTYVTAPLQDVRRVVLPDGSRVWLNAGSRLRYLRDFADSARKVDLRGEAYFEVRNNPKHPFIVRSNILVVKGNGVAFNFSNDRQLNRADVSLVSGTLDVWCRNAQGMVTLLAGQKASLDRNTGVFTVTPTKPVLDAVWHGDYMPLHGVKLKQLAEMLSYIYKTDVKVGASADADFKCSGMLPYKKNIRAVLAAIQEKLPVSVREDGGKFYIEAR